jgi:hypothetical protein
VGRTSHLQNPLLQTICALVSTIKIHIITIKSLHFILQLGTLIFQPTNIYQYTLSFLFLFFLAITSDET